MKKAFLVSAAVLFSAVCFAQNQAQRPVYLDPNAPVEVGHSTCTACTLGNIAHEVKHAIKWDPDKQVFVGDDELMNHRLVKYTYREGYTLG